MADADVLELFGAAYLRLRALVEGGDIAEAQWRPGYSPSPKEDTTERSSGRVSDPVWFALTDPRRQALRRAVNHAEHALRLAEHTLRVAEAKLGAAVRASSGRPELGGHA
ncbi:DUF7169 domain-containing protein [Microbacterium oxydans]|uniref:DUF7169 domain-containing protein n=1 Tax=Microbacterium oxydans TaxID=82380 RepID=UPI00226B04D3|nr:hypothetical protein [Microbacterium oxydans]WAA67784.1 hypothetical protein MME74_08520 [Microbacterium oxydans]